MRNRFRLVPGEATGPMLQTACDSHHPDQPMSEDDQRECPHIANRRRAFSVMLASAPALTTADVDELATAYEDTHPHGPADHWQRNADGSWVSTAPIHDKRRNDDRARMRAFLLAAFGCIFTEPKP